MKKVHKPGYQFSVGELRHMGGFKRGVGDRQTLLKWFGFIPNQRALIAAVEEKKEWAEMFKRSDIWEEFIWLYCRKYDLKHIELMTKKEILDELYFRAAYDIYF